MPDMLAKINCARTSEKNKARARVILNDRLRRNENLYWWIV